MSSVTLAAAVILAVTAAARAQTSAETPSPGAVAEPTKLPVTVRFEGRNVADHWAKFSAKAIRKFGSGSTGEKPKLVRQVDLGDRKSLCEVYVQDANLPGCSEGVQKLAEELNPGPLQPNQKVNVPDLKLEETTWGKVFDTEDERERLELEDYRKKWEHVRFEEYKKGERVRESLPGYKIEATFTPEEADAFEDAFYSADIPNANISRSTGEGALYSSFLPADEHALACRDGAPPAEKGSYARMLEAHDRIGSCEGNKCPVVVLVDTELYKHPALAPALLTDAKVTADDGTPAAAGQCPYVPVFKKEDHHGTHLAGIMVARDVAGSHFIGLAQDAKLYGVVWDHDQAALVETMTRLIESESSTSGRPQVWVFASKFKYNQRDLSDGTLRGDRDRLQGPTAARAVVNERLLWITAVGQPETQDQAPQTIERTKPMSPMNLGDQENVVVVTACEVCKGPDLRLWRDANVGAEDLVHVAAPGGKPVPGIATAHRHADAFGTSQAAAFVGGVAAAMLAEHPQNYDHPYQVKRRLQLTAAPVIRAGDRIATGVVQPDLALCDPGTHWFEHSSELPRTKEHCAGKHQAVADMEWCVALFDLKRLDASDESDLEVIRAKHVHRIVKVSPKDDRDRWIFYTFEEDHNDRRSKARIVKHGPAAPTAGTNPAVAQIKYKDGSTGIVWLSDIRDLLLSTPTSKITAQCDAS